MIFLMSGIFDSTEIATYHRDAVFSPWRRSTALARPRAPITPSTSLLSALILMLAASHVRADELMLPYAAFGPQAIAYQLIGMEWWQWDSHGDEHDHEYPIQVVVFWNQTREETAKRHPVDQAKLRDFRYVEYSKAVEHLEETIKEFGEAKLDALAMERALTQLKKRKAEQGGAGQPATRPSRNDPLDYNRLIRICLCMAGKKEKFKARGTGDRMGSDCGLITVPYWPPL